MAKTLISGPIRTIKTSCDFYLYWLEIVSSFHPIEFKGKLMKQV